MKPTDPDARPPDPRDAFSEGVLPGDPGLRRLVRRRKALDAAFAVAGALLVCASLSVLILLVLKLVGDGSRRLTSHHEVNSAGFAPGFRDLVGTLLAPAPESGGEWILLRDTLTLTHAEAVVGQEVLQKLEGQEVLAKGEVPEPGRLAMEIASILPAGEMQEARLARDAVTGILARGPEEWKLDPSPIRLDLSEAEGDPRSLAGRRVVVAVGLSKTLPLKVRSVGPLVRQSFLGSMPSREASRAGVKSALIGSALVVLVTLLLAVPVGIAAGLYLEEYGKKSWFTAFIEINIANLAGVPSIVWGLIALGLLVYTLGLGRSILTAGITLALLVLPMVIMATRESVRAIPQHIREAAYACGASKWQTVRHHVLPYSLPGVLTGSIIGLSRAIGETAPLITIGALTYVAFLPDFSLSEPFAWLGSSFTVLPIQIFNWVSRPDRSFQENAAAGAIILLALTLSMNAVAIVLRYRLRKRVRW